MQGQRGGIVKIELVHGVGTVRLHGLDADESRSGISLLRIAYSIKKYRVHPIYSFDETRVMSKPNEP